MHSEQQDHTTPPPASPVDSLPPQSVPTWPTPTTWPTTWPAPPPRRRSGGAGRLGAGVAALVLVGGFALHSFQASSPYSSSTSTPASSSGSSSASGPILGRPQWSAGSRQDPTGWGSGAFGQAQLATATDAQARGVVDVDVALAGGGRAAGTGMVLTSGGEVLTNRHVVAQATNLAVTVPATGRTYSAHVVGVAADTDVAVVQLDDATGLTTVSTSSSGVSEGDAVVGVGNAGGEGGTPSAAPGEVTGVDRSITATDDDGSNPEQLTGLIETDAGIQPGDSGGPLLNTSDQVVGMDTAGSTRGGDGYAIPIATALSAAKQIEAHPSGSSGGQSTGQSNGTGAHLGVEVQDGPWGVQIVGVVAGSPAAAAGLTAGDTLTSVAGQPVRTVSDLASVMASLTPGRTVQVTWTDEDGQEQAAKVTPVAASA